MLGAVGLTSCGGSNNKNNAANNSSSSGSAPAAPTTSGAAGTATVGLNPAAKPGGTLHTNISASADPPNLDPMLNRSFQTQSFSGFVYSRLLRFKTGPNSPASSYQVEGDLASTWEQPDPQTVIFHLKPNAKWQNKAPVNGRPLVAADVAYSFKRFTTEPKNVFPHALGPVTDVTATDDHTVQFKLSAPFAPLLTLLAEFYLAIMPHEVIEQFGDASQPDHAVGSGPFLLRTYQRGVALTFDRNPDYYDAPLPYLATVVNHIIPDPATQVAQFRSGQLDLFAPSQEDYTALKSSNPNVKANEYTSLAMNWIYCDVTQPPFNDPRVRQALYKALDRDGMLKVWFNGHGAWDTILSPGQGDFWLDPKGTAFGPNADVFKFDPQGAKQLLAAAGHSDGLSVPLYYANTAYGQLFNQVAETVIAPSAKQGGFNVQLKPTEYNTYIATIDQGHTDGGFVFGYNITWVEPDESIWNACDPNGGHNVSHINDAQLTSMIQAERGDLNTDTRKAKIQDIQRYMASKAYYPGGVTGTAVAAYQPKVQDLYWKGDYLWASDVLPHVWLKG